MSNLYWYSRCPLSLMSVNQNPVTNFKIEAKGFALIHENNLSPILKEYVFTKDEQKIRICLYLNVYLEELILFVQEGSLKETFMENLKSKDFSGFHYDLFISAIEPEAIIKEIEAALLITEEPDHLHIYGQASWHQDAFIIGHRSALIQLRKAIDEAIEHGEKREVFSPVDGEGYNLYISCVDDSFDLEEIDEPYHDPDIFEKRKPPAKAFKLYKIEE